MPRAFADVPVISRPPKPRESALTMVQDRGLGLAQLEDLLIAYGEQFDLLKVVTGLAALTDSDLLRRKIAMCREHQVIAFPGGQLLEYVLWQDCLEAYLDEVAAVGFDTIEVSENLYELGLERKAALIRRCVQQGLRVLGETGTKDQSSDAAVLIRDIRSCLEAGSWKVLVEAAEFFAADGTFDADLARAIAAEVDKDQLIFELPGSWIKGISASDVYATADWLFTNLGRDVSVGNVLHENLMTHEMQRRNLGAVMRFDVPIR